MISLLSTKYTDLIFFTNAVASTFRKFFRTILPIFPLLLFLYLLLLLPLLVLLLLLLLPLLPSYLPCSSLSATFLLTFDNSLTSLAVTAT